MGLIIKILMPELKQAYISQLNCKISFRKIDAAFLTPACFVPFITQ